MMQTDTINDRNKLMFKILFWCLLTNRSSVIVMLLYYCFYSLKVVFFQALFFDFANEEVKNSFLVAKKHTHN